MATPTYIALATTTLPSNTASITFSSIPSGYRDLVLVINGKGSSSVDNFFWCYFNNDTGASYSRVEMSGTGSGSGNSSVFSNLIPLTLNNTNTSTHIISVMDYSANNKHKAVLYRNNALGSGAKVLAGAGRWASNSPITSIKIQGYLTAVMNTGTVLSLYGIEA